MPLLLTGIISGTRGGAGGNITLDAPEITVRNGAFVASSSVGGEGGGDITLSGDRILIERGGIVTGTSLLTPAKGGAVTLDARESIEVVGRSVFGDPSQVSSATLNQGPAGSVTLMAPRIVVDGGAVATVAVPLNVGLEGGAAGEIKLDAGGDGGRVIVRNGGQVAASTVGTGDGGSIEILAGESIRVEGDDSSIASRTGGDGTGGNVVLRAPRIEVASGAKVSAESSAGLGELGAIANSFRDHLRDAPPTAKGNAGSIELLGADEVRLRGGTIATDAELAHGGGIEIEARRLVHLIDSEITTAVRDSGSGGDIRIDPVFVILQDHSVIKADAGEVAGNGGHVSITSDNFFPFPGSEVSATSGAGVAGTIEIHSPDVNLAGTLATLPSTFLDAASQMHERCAARKGGERVGSFAVRGAGGIPAEPDGWLPAPLLPDAAATTVAVPAEPLRVASLAGPLLLHGRCP